LYALCSDYRGMDVKELVLVHGQCAGRLDSWQFGKYAANCDVVESRYRETNREGARAKNEQQPG
jgi:hypothetical protein